MAHCGKKDVLIVGGVGCENRSACLLCPCSSPLTHTAPGHSVRRQLEATGDDGHHGQGARRRRVHHGHAVRACVCAVDSQFLGRDLTSSNCVEQVLHRQRRHDCLGGPAARARGRQDANGRDHHHAAVPHGRGGGHLEGRLSAMFVLPTCPASHACQGCSALLELPIPLPLACTERTLIAPHACTTTTSLGNFECAFLFRLKTCPSGKSRTDRQQHLQDATQQESPVRAAERASSSIATVLLGASFSTCIRC